MVYGHRLSINDVTPRPRVVLDKRFGFTQGLEVGDKGQLDAIVRVDSVSLEIDDNGNERFVFYLKLDKASLINANNKKK